MKSPKIKTLKELSTTIKKLKWGGKKVALITGCFDVLHLGHIRLFKFAKQHADIVVVGVENDWTIRTNKGAKRPIHKLKDRVESLTEMISIDYIFTVKSKVNYNSPSANKIYQKIYKTLLPNYLVTNPQADKFWGNKGENAKEIDAILLKNPSRRSSSSTSIIDKLLDSEF